MADFDGEFSVQDDDAVLPELKSCTRGDLILFYKESLVDTSRYGNATHFST